MIFTTFASFFQTSRVKFLLPSARLGEETHGRTLLASVMLLRRFGSKLRFLRLFHDRSPLSNWPLHLKDSNFSIKQKTWLKMFYLRQRPLRLPFGVLQRVVRAQESIEKLTNIRRWRDDGEETDESAADQKNRTDQKRIFVTVGEKCSGESSTKDISHGRTRTPDAEDQTTAEIDGENVHRWTSPVFCLFYPSFPNQFPIIATTHGQPVDWAKPFSTQKQMYQGME